MRLIIERPARQKEYYFEGSAKDLLEKEGINQETVLVVKNGELVGTDETISDSDSVKLLSVISGG